MPVCWFLWDNICCSSLYQLDVLKEMRDHISSPRVQAFTERKNREVATFPALVPICQLHPHVWPANILCVLGAGCLSAYGFRSLFPPWWRAYIRELSLHRRPASTTTGEHCTWRYCFCICMSSMVSRCTSTLMRGKSTILSSGIRIVVGSCLLLLLWGAAFFFFFL